MGDHIKNRRLELGLLQREVATVIGVTVDSITLWEGGKAQPQVQYFPKIISFLNYAPFQYDDSLGNQLKKIRELKGLSQKKLAVKLKVDGATISSWETGENKPNRKNLGRVQKLIEEMFNTK